MIAPRLSGAVIRLSPTYVTLFNRLSLVYHRTSYTATSSQPSKPSSITASLLARFGKRRYPDYIVSRSFSIFPSRKSLKQFEAAMEVERLVEESLEGIWGPGVPKREKESGEEKKARFKEGTRIWEEVEDEWKELCQEAELEMKQEEDDGEKRRLYYRRRFHPGWPLSRAAYKAAACYAKLVRYCISLILHQTYPFDRRVITNAKSRFSVSSSLKLLSDVVNEEIGMIVWPSF